MSYVNKPVRKKDARALVTGQPVYTDDLAPKDCLIVKVLRSPHAHAWIEEIKTELCGTRRCHCCGGDGKSRGPCAENDQG